MWCTTSRRKSSKSGTPSTPLRCPSRRTRWAGESSPSWRPLGIQTPSAPKTPPTRRRRSEGAGGGRRDCKGRKLIRNWTLLPFKMGSWWLRWTTAHSPALTTEFLHLNDFDNFITTQSYWLDNKKLISTTLTKEWKRNYKKEPLVSRSVCLLPLFFLLNPRDFWAHHFTTADTSDFVSSSVSLCLTRLDYILFDQISDFHTLSFLPVFVSSLSLHYCLLLLFLGLLLLLPLRMSIFYSSVLFSPGPIIVSNCKVVSKVLQPTHNFFFLSLSLSLQRYSNRHTNTLCFFILFIFCFHFYSVFLPWCYSASVLPSRAHRHCCASKSN